MSFIFLMDLLFVSVKKKHLAMSFFHSDCESSKEQSNKKSSFFSLDKGERCWNILKMTKIWSMNRPSWMNAILSLQFKLTSSWCLFLCWGYAAYSRRYQKTAVKHLHFWLLCKYVKFHSFPFPFRIEQNRIAKEMHS